MAGAIEAMAHAQQGDRSAARSLLEKYAAFAELPPNAADLGAEWKEWIYADLGREWKATVLAHALLAEARTLIDAPSVQR